MDGVPLKATSATGGYLQQKGVHSASVLSQFCADACTISWPIIRLGELYLDYAER